jgi:hypothetical protein
MKHKHSETIKAWADGAKIQYLCPPDYDKWIDVTTPNWDDDNLEYRLKPSTENQVQSDIDHILENFDFHRANEVMTVLNWHWYGIGIPSIDQLRDRARELLNDVVDGINKKTDDYPNQAAHYYVATGGFYVDGSKYPDSPKLYLRLSFQVTEWDNWE